MIGDLPASDVDGEAIRLSGFSAALFDSDLEVPAGIGRQGLPAPRRFAVYRNTVIVSLLEALRSTFPSLLAIMGAETFDRVARVFISRHPPRSAMMQAYGDRFADFLTGFKPLAGSPFLADVARAERAWLDAYHAADAPVLTGGMLADLTPEKAQTLRLKRHPAATMIASSYPLFDLFRAREVWPRPGVDLEEPVLRVALVDAEKADPGRLAERADAVQRAPEVGEGDAGRRPFDGAPLVRRVVAQRHRRPGRRRRQQGQRQRRRTQDLHAFLLPLPRGRPIAQVARAADCSRRAGGGSTMSRARRLPQGRVPA